LHRIDIFCKGLQEYATVVTIYVVARAVGVSVSTVSRAFSMPNLVAAGTRQRILSAAHKLGYEPNRAARGLITGKTHNIGVIVPDIANPFFAAMIKSVQRQASLRLLALPGRHGRRP